MYAKQATALRVEKRAASRRPEARCTIDDDGGRLVAQVDGPDNGWSIGDSGSAGARLDLGPSAHVDALVAEHRQLFAEGSAADSTEALVEATEDLLGSVYDMVVDPLLPLLEPFPRVALALGTATIRSLPIETANRFGEPALFEVTQLYRETSDSNDDGWQQPRRFALSLSPTTLEDLDVIALEQCLIHSVSAATGLRRTEYRCEPLIHVAGHDPIIPAGLVDADDLAHVVLSGCNSLPTVLPPGVASAVGSLWPVDEATNSSIMAAYHSRLAMGINPVESLRQAQMLHRRLPPIAWASYVHIGQPV